jgi:signal peptidase I
MYNKEPWLAVNLSKIFPGLGQIYSGKKQKGYLLIFLTITLNIVAFWFIISPDGDILVGIGCLIGNLIFSFWNLFDAYVSAKSNNSQEFEELRKQNKDPWLGMFLSQLFLGVGNFYIGKWLFGILAVIIILIFSKIFPVVLPVIYGYIGYFTYTLSPVQRENSKKLAFIVSLLFAISGLFPTGLGFAIKNYGVEARWMPSGSMKPTLHGTINQWEADKIFIDKVKYKFANPERGDIVLFLPPQEIQNNPKREAFIKRVIGLPGEKVELREGKVYINSKPLPENVYLSSSVRTFVEACNSSGLQPPFLAKPEIIPANSYLMLGDNRPNSYDGRCWGVVPRNMIIGKAYKIFFPLNRMRKIE